MMFVDKVATAILLEGGQPEISNQRFHARLAGPEPGRTQIEGGTSFFMDMNTPAKTLARFDKENAAMLSVKPVGQRHTRQAGTNDQDVGLHRTLRPISSGAPRTGHGSCRR